MQIIKKQVNVKVLYIIAYIVLILGVAAAGFTAIGKHTMPETRETETDTGETVTVIETPETEVVPLETETPDTEPVETETEPETEETEPVTEPVPVTGKRTPETKKAPPPETTVIVTDTAAPPEEVTKDPDGWLYFKLTAYCPCVKCSGKWGSMTSTGVTAVQGKTIAVNPRQIPYGSVVEIDGYGTYIAQDCGVVSNQIDIYFNNHQDTVNFGVRYAYVRWH